MKNDIQKDNIQPTEQKLQSYLYDLNDDELDYLASRSHQRHRIKTSHHHLG